MLYPIGIQSFEKIRTGGFVYVDKTELIYSLAASGQYYFLSRPRRFGKSLLVSTMEAYFSGERKFFSGLAMERLEKDWVKYPVLHLDLTGAAYLSLDELIAKLNLFLSAKICSMSSCGSMAPSFTTLALTGSGLNQGVPAAL